MNRFRSAFTLVELLIVIAIIGILMAILLPSLSAARAAAGRAACGSNMHQVVMAMSNFASDNKDALYYPGMGNTPNAAKVHLPSNLDGLTSPIKYLTNDLNYDPALPKDYKYYTGGGSSIAHYTVTPIIGLSGTSSATNSGVVRRFSKLSDVPNDKALVIDTLRLAANQNHPTKGGLPYWNLAFRDASVKTVTLPRPALDNWKRLNANAWFVHNDMIRIMELIASGKDPQYAGFGESRQWPFATNNSTASHRYIPLLGGNTKDGKRHALTDR